MEIISKYPNKPWVWEYVSQNPNISMEFIEKNCGKSLKGEYISQNTFAKEKELFFEKYYRKYLAAFRLQQYFNRMYDNPDYLFCRKRLEKLFA